MEVSRRSFLMGAGLLGAGAAAGVLGCSPAAQSASSAGANAGQTDAATTGEQVQASAESTPTQSVSSSIDWLGPEPSVSDADVSEVLEADVVVVGLSNAGCAAVRSAVEEGASVIAVEKSEGIMTAGSQISLFDGNVHEQVGWDAIDKAEVVETLQRECGYRNNRSIMSRFVNEVGSVFDWLLEADPDAYITDSSFPVLDEEQSKHALIPERFPLPDPSWDYHNEVNPTFPGTVTIKGLNTLMKLNVEKAKSEGDVQEFYGHFAEKLVMEGGKCVGVYVRDAATGEYKRMNARKGVVLATGDYSSDETMLKAFLPALVENDTKFLWLKTDVEGNPTNTGDGHKMAVWAGAKMQEYHSPSMHHMGGGAGADGRGVMGINGYLNLNLRGKRFMNEDLPGQQLENQLELQPKRTTYQFFDSKWPEQCSKFPAAHGVVCYFSEEESTSYINHRCLADVEAAVADGRALAADTIEELLAQIEGMDVEVAAQSIERYNELCKAGEDLDFQKNARRLFPLENPPFYAVKFEPCLCITVHGGPSSDEDCHTFTEDGDVIPGLYVAGNTMGDRFAMQKPISVCGMSVGLSLFYGTIAGRNAANMV